jgi:hypothetical protein
VPVSVATMLSLAKITWGQNRCSTTLYVPTMICAAQLRDIDRTEKKLIQDIKLTAKRPGSEKAVRTLAGQLVGLRKQREKLYSMKVRLVHAFDTSYLGCRECALAHATSDVNVHGRSGK